MMGFRCIQISAILALCASGCVGSLGRKNNAPDVDLVLITVQNSVRIGESISIKAMLEDKDISDRVVWTVSDESVLQAGPGGHFKALAAGSAVIFANISILSAETHLEVLPAAPAELPADTPAGADKEPASSEKAGAPALSFSAIDRTAGTFRLIVAAQNPDDLIAVSEKIGDEVTWLTPSGPGDNSKAFFPAQDFGAQTGLLISNASLSADRIYQAIAKNNGRESDPSAALTWKARPIPTVSAAINGYLTSMRVKLGGDADATYAVSVSDGSIKTWLGPDGNLFHTEPQWGSLPEFGGTEGITTNTVLGKTYTIGVKSFLPNSFYSEEITAVAVDTTIANLPPEVSNLALTWSAGTLTLTVTWDSGGGSTSGYYVDYKRSGGSSPESGPVACSGNGAVDWSTWGSVRSFSKTIASGDETKFHNFLICAYDSSNPRLVSYGRAISYKPSSAELKFGSPVSMIAEETGSQFGFAVATGSHSAVSQSRINIAIGAPAADLDDLDGTPVTDAGKVYFRHYNNSDDVVAADRELVATGANARQAGDRYGHAVGIGTKYLAVGAPFHDYDADGANPVSDAGAVFVYEHNAGADSWDLIRKYVSPTRQTGGHFGHSIFMIDNFDNSNIWLIGVGAPGEGPGRLYVFGDIAGSGLPLPAAGPQVTLSGEQNGDRFGTSIVLASSNFILVGAPKHKFDALGANELVDAGAVYTFQDFNQDLTFELMEKLVPVTTGARRAGDQFGFSLSIQGAGGAHGANVIAGAPYRDLDENGENPVTDTGMVYVFSSSNSPKDLSIASCSGNDAVLDGSPDLSAVLPGDYFIDEAGNLFSIASIAGATITLTGGPCTTDGSDDAAVVKPYQQGQALHLGMISSVQRTAGSLFGHSLVTGLGAFTIGIPGYPLDASGKAPLRNAGAAYRINENTVTMITSKDRRPDGMFGYAVTSTLIASRQIIGQPGLVTSPDPGRVEMTTCAVIPGTDGSISSALMLLLLLPLLFAVRIRRQP